MHRKNPEGHADLCDACHLMYERGLAHAAGGNASIRIDDGILITPTGIGLDRVQPDDLVHVGIGGQVLGSRQPSKELDLHLELYRTRPAAHAVLHPHPPHATAWTARYPEPRLDAIPATNAGFYIRAGQIPQLPYLRSGSQQLRAAVARLARDFATILLGNHGLICAGATPRGALEICEEIEQNCRILLLAGEGGRVLSPAERAELDEARGRVWPGPADYADFFAAL